MTPTGSREPNGSTHARPCWKTEKELTRLHDRIQRATPGSCRGSKSTRPYVFDGPSGKESLADLFAGRSQLIVQHFMFGPGWKEGCVGCSFSPPTTSPAPWRTLSITTFRLCAVSRAPFA